MHSTMGVGLKLPVGTVFKVQYGEEIESINSWISKADTLEGSNLVPQRKEYYEEAFKQLRTVALQQNGILPLELHSKLYEILYRFAGTRYGQDEEEGFRDCASLLELSLGMQCKDLGLNVNLGKEGFSWKNIDSIAGLIVELNADVDNRFLDVVQFSKQVTSLELYNCVALSELYEEPSDERKMFADSLVKLLFCYQNISTLNGSNEEKILKLTSHSEICRLVEIEKSKKQTLHSQLQELAKTAIDEQTPEQVKTLAEFLYNRCSFMVELGHENPESDACKQAQIESYSSIEDLLITHKDFGKKSPMYLAKKAQIENMRGLINLRMSEPDLDIAEGHFREALKFRLELQIPNDVEGKWEYHFLFNNLRTGLMHVLTVRATEEDVDEAIQHAIPMAQFVIDSKAEGRNHCYNKSYHSALTKVLSFLGENPDPHITKAIEIGAPKK